MSDRPTPETDAYITSQSYSPTEHQWRCFARKLERERDEARERERVAILSFNEERQRALREGERVLEAIRERDEALELLASEKITRNHIIKRSVEVEKERDDAREDAERWESSSDAMERAGAEQARRADENREWALKAERERDELESALRRLLNADIPRPLGGIIDDDERKAAIEWNAFERGEARQHAKAILQQNKEEAK